MQAVSRFKGFSSETVETVFGMISSFADTSLKRGANEMTWKPSTLALSSSTDA